ncbi:MAG: hypothetical protein M3P08_07805 [Thermoproteota archaeon]|nr:hypothetical protein [Thermoproteota archaeon]
MDTSHQDISHAIWHYHMGPYPAGCVMIVGRKGKSKIYYLMPNVQDVILVIKKLLHMLEIITISDANIVGTNGLKAGVQVWQKKTNHRLCNVKLE